jgi:hypothetical protein
MRPIPRLPAAALCGCLAAQSLAAQTLRGRLLDDNTERPIEAAFVILMDDDDTRRDSVFTDSTGAFLFRTPKPGHYRVTARRVGYERTTTPALKLKRGETMMVDFLIGAAVTKLAPVKVTARRGGRVQGREVGDFGARYVSREDIRPRMRGARHFGDLLRWQNIPGLRISERSWGELCVTMARSSAGCMDVYLDGSPMSGAHALNPLSIDRMVVILPQEAMVLYGSQARRGVLLIFSRRGLPTGDELTGDGWERPTTTVERQQ